MSNFLSMNLSKVLRSKSSIQMKIFSRILTHQKSLSRHCSVRRAVFFAPGNDMKALETALKFKLDCIIMDCEKSVPLQEKENARQNIKNLLDSGRVTANDPEWCVRINPVQTPELCEADITTLLSATNLPITICLPMVNNVNQLEWFTEKVWKALLERPEEGRRPIKLMLQIESPKAMLGLEEICKKAEDLSTMAPVVPDALVFQESLVDNIGARKTNSRIESLYLQQKFVLVAKAFGLQAIDKPFLNYKDMRGLKESCSDGVILGFTGKQVIHMDQIVIVQDEFTPSRSKIHWAKTIIKAHRESQEQEDFGFDNSLVDSSLLRQAENVVSVAKAAGLQIESEALQGHNK